MARELGTRRRALTLGGYAQQCLEQHVDRVIAEIEGAGAGLDADRVHDLRVAIRRVREAVRVFTPLGAAERASHLLKRLKGLMEAAAAVRDLDIAMELAAVAGLARDGALMAEFLANREDARERLALLVEKAARPKFTERLRALPELPEDQTPLHASCASLLATMARDYFAAGRKALVHPTPKRLHQLRLRTKHLRYTLELFAALAPEAVDRQLRELRAVQELLGVINDRAVTLERCAGRRSQEFRALAAHLKAGLTESTSQFLLAWAELEKCEPHWIETLRGLGNGTKVSS
jgi:CHAD domain-containing protein